MNMPTVWDIIFIQQICYTANLPLLTVFLPFNAVIIFPFAMVGFLFFPFPDQKKNFRYLALLTLTFALGLLLFFIFSRFRVPLYPVLCIAAIAGMYKILLFWKKPSKKPCDFIVLLTLVLFFVIVNADPKVDRKLDTAIHFRNLAADAFIKYDYENAERFYRMSLNAQKTGKAAYGLGLILMNKRQFAEAAELLEFAAMEGWRRPDSIYLCIKAYQYAGLEDRSKRIAGILGYVLLSSIFPIYPILPID